MSNSQSIVKRLYADACSGIIFNYGSEIRIGDRSLPKGIFLLPVKKEAEHMELPPDAKLAGIRFHPGVCFSLLDRYSKEPFKLYSNQYNMHLIYSELQKRHTAKTQIESISHWLLKYSGSIKTIPACLQTAFHLINQGETPGNLSDKSYLSQRQIERQFKHYLGLTAKQYQRILRVKKAVNFMRKNTDISLSDIAQQFGFSDQSHMTREFQAIAHITPGQLSNLVVNAVVSS